MTNKNGFSFFHSNNGNHRKLENQVNKNALELSPSSDYIFICFVQSKDFFVENQHFFTFYIKKISVFAIILMVVVKRFGYHPRVTWSWEKSGTTPKIPINYNSIVMWSMMSYRKWKPWRHSRRNKTENLLKYKMKKCGYLTKNSRGRNFGKKLSSFNFPLSYSQVKLDFWFICHEMNSWSFKITVYVQVEILKIKIHVVWMNKYSLIEVV